MTTHENAMAPPAPELRTLRETAGLTQKSLAAALDVTPPTIYKWEDGTAMPAIRKLPRLAEVLGVSITDLVLTLVDERGGGTGGEI